VDITGIGIAEFENNKNQITIHPNPFSTSTTITIGQPLNNASLVIFNPFGQVVKRINNITGENIMIKRSGLSTGIYVLSIEENGSVVSTIRMDIVD
jgi:Secretion system C-terminal sorting domain